MMNVTEKIGFDASPDGRSAGKIRASAGPAGSVEMKKILERLAAGELMVSDGALGTQLHASGLRAGECPESWCVSHAEAVRSIAASYQAAGAQIVSTNSFGASRLRLKAEGLEEKVGEFNRAAVACVREAVGTESYVAGSIGPTSLMAKGEGGQTTAADFEAAFGEQAAALAEGGADLLLIETQFSLIEALAAIRAAKAKTSLPVFCTFSFEKKSRGFFTITGLTPEKAAREALAAGADVVGSNCGNGIDAMVEVAGLMRGCGAPLMVQANAGLPHIINGRTVFNETPESMAAHVPALIAAGARIIGGCCGTTPAHIAAIAAAVHNYRANV